MNFLGLKHKIFPKLDRRQEIKGVNLCDGCIKTLNIKYKV